jgi:hypothetical protein
MAVHSASVSSVHLHCTPRQLQLFGSHGLDTAGKFHTDRWITDGGNQQFSASNLVFNGCDTAVQLDWDWVWVWQRITVENCGTGFVLTASGGTGVVGSVTFIDSVFTGISKSAIVLTTPTSTPDKGSTGVVLDNVALGGNVADQNGNQLLAAGYVKNVSRGLACLPRLLLRFAS